VRQRGLTDYLRIFRRRKWYIIGTTILVAALAVALSLRQQRLYQAQSQVVLSRLDIAGSITGAQNPSLSEDPARYAATQASIARSSPLAQLAIKESGVPGRTESSLLKDSSVTPSSTADVLDFIVQDRSPATAAKLAYAYATAFVAYQLQLQTNALSRARRQLKQQLSRLARLGLSQSPAYRRLANSEQQLHTMQLLQSQDTVLNHPARGSQVQPTPRRDGLLGVAFGVLIGLGLAFAAEALDRRVRTVEEVEEQLGLPVLARIPTTARRHGHGIAMIDQPRSPYAEALRRLATSIVFSNPDRPARMLLFTSALEREGKSTTLANLGVALAALGNRVVLVDLDLRRPALPSFFGVHQLTGLTDVAVGRKPLDAALVQVGFLNLTWDDEEGDDPSDLPPCGSLHLLPTGPLPPNPGEFVASEALAARVLAPLHKKADYILVDSPPACAFGDAARVSAQVDAVVVVTRIGVANRSALQDLRRQLAAAPVPPLGLVVVDDNPPGIAGYARYFKYGYTPRSLNGKTRKSLPARRAGV
jgi:succinoglycan biosynthesis transport protein ExoP